MDVSELAHEIARILEDSDQIAKAEPKGKVIRLTTQGGIKYVIRIERTLEFPEEGDNV